MYRAAACCIKCRSHVSIQLDDRTECLDAQPCQGLHHFLPLADGSGGRHLQQHEDGDLSWSDARYFKCSKGSCPTTLSIKLHSPQLRASWAELLTDRNLIAHRAQVTIAAAPDRYEGHGMPLPVSVLHGLYSYLLDAVRTKTPRRINGNNKKFRLYFGEPCISIFLALGFSQDV